ncbi:YjgF-like protein [Aspergillus steynii IBT 23096]|uniref:YjgF-like protein n=1 Tax=Aspergillus steynii IBT 23096 TaxID=1392250 RepID=A0A2I2G9Y4_9EURO|nr:YjgF-like protein [Aspergillus steynii IBT 23096]PLB49687.1 YjgF-like protein [Aspergillus steynii IBT 23096]
MSSITYQNLPGPVGDCLKPLYATTAKVPVSPTTSLIYITGHIGLDLATGSLVSETPEAEFEAIFKCLDAALKHAGAARGLAQSYRLTSYLVNAEDEKTMQEVFQRLVPGHTPTWCTVLVNAINVKGMRAEITAEGAAFE